MATDNKISELVDQYVPDFVRSYSPKLITFLKLYYKWLEQEGLPTDARYNLLNTADINETAEKFLLQFHNEFLVHIPRNVVADERLFLKHAQEFYRAKGSQKAFQILFRILYDEDVELYIPGVDILRASDGRWEVEKSITVTLLSTVSVLLAAEGLSITGVTSGARARVERITKTISGGSTVYEMFLSGIITGFEANEIITLDGDQIGQVVSVIEYAGSWVGTKGFLSSDKYLQDNDFYQEYSYQLKTGAFVDKYRELVKKICHPAGTKLFGKFVLIAEISFPVVTAAAERDVAFGSEATGDIVLDAESTTLIGDILDTIILEMKLVVDIDAPSPDVTNQVLTWTNSLAGTVITANTENISFYEANLISDFTSWTPEDYTNGKGLLGSGAFWDVDIVANTDVMILYDRNNQDANSMHITTVPDSNLTMIIPAAYPFNDMSNGAIYLPTYR